MERAATFYAERPARATAATTAVAVEVGHPLHSDRGYKVHEHDHQHDHGNNHYTAWVSFGGTVIGAHS